MKRVCYTLLLCVCLFVGLSFSVAWAQVTVRPEYERSAAFKGNEQLHYSVYFKWGVVKGKAGNATITMQQRRGAKEQQWFQQLKFRTTGLFEKIFPMRDTLETLYMANHMPKHWEKRCNEGGYYLADAITYNYLEQGTRLAIKRRNATSTRIDTLVTVPRGKPLADMLSAFSLLRGFDVPTTPKAVKLPFLVPIGRDLVKCMAVFEAFDTIQLSESQEFHAIRLALVVDDPAFDTASRPVHIWLSHDEHLVPLKIRAKLAIGYAECTLTSVTRQP